jgi:hypothetical protein
MVLPEPSFLVHHIDDELDEGHTHPIFGFSEAPGFIVLK